MGARAKRGARGGAQRWRWLALAAVLALAALGGWWLASRQPAKPVRGPRAQAQVPAKRATRGHRAPARPAKKAESPERPAGNLALVIDDLGRSVDEVAALDELRVPLSYSVLPYEVMTPEVVARLRGEHREILCHLPMQPLDHRNPGPGALNEAMGDQALEEATRAALARVPGAVGANNHMGSRLTEDPRAMGAVLQVLQQEGLFFLDSRTSAGSVGYRLARSLGLPAAQRQVFLDDDLSDAAIREQFARFLARARESGGAIAIAHPHPATLAVLREEVPKARAEGFVFVPVSFLLDRSGSPL
jgi:uncharacterized protein